MLRFWRECLAGILLFTFSWTAGATHFSRQTYPAELNTHLQTITQEIHPAGSSANRRVGDYILANIPEPYRVTVQEFTVSGKLLRNILAYHDRGFAETMLLSTHYDSADNSYGAGDIGVGVASSLSLLDEWAKMPLERNLLVAFVDGEEPMFDFEEGETSDHDHSIEDDLFEILLHGSRYFVRTYTGEFGRISHIFNFEGRGTGGTNILFESVNYSAQELAFLNERWPSWTFSLGEALYEVAPNTTDVVMYREFEDAKILGFAIIGEVEHYHTSQDTFANVDEISKTTIYQTMRRVVSTQIPANLSRIPVLYASVGSRMLVLPTLAVQILAVISGFYLLFQTYRTRSWRFLPILVILGTFWWAEYSFVFLLSAVWFGLVYRYRRVLGRDFAPAIWLLGSGIVSYTQLVALAQYTGGLGGFLTYLPDALLFFLLQTPLGIIAFLGISLYVSICLLRNTEQKANV